ncbi:hypothetical protein LX16_5257 [Stackebrandtia albiflava]|uniref:Uncharacterized protein n=1 Tax=Stackebrandtia albiflava TaxID=406432 RepID=A0A562ULN4_9ACTN|nr:hypothetical protein [Stackebrandtia albiflava]TWJ06520.1 hypothetical protein LX16_5257 [Stackebrandtia albiflava]
MTESLHGLRIAGSAFNWALRFYVRHLPLVVGVSLIPSVQRFWLVSEGDRVGAPLAVGTEVVAEGTRVVLVWLLLRLAFRGDPLLRPLTVRRRWRLLTDFIDRHLVAFLTQFVVLAAAFVVLDLLPNTAIATLVPADDRDTVTAVVVAAKNPTVIAMTFIWMIGVGVAMMRATAAPPSTAPATTPGDGTERPARG